MKFHIFTSQTKHTRATSTRYGKGLRHSKFVTTFLLCWLFPGTDDEYEIGDLSGKYGSFLNLTLTDKRHIDYNLPLFGRNSIQGRSVVIHKLKIQDKNARWVCNNIIPVVDPATSYVMKATANFTGPTLTGVVLMVSWISSI